MAVVPLRHVRMVYRLLSPHMSSLLHEQPHPFLLLVLSLLSRQPRHRHLSFLHLFSPFRSCGARMRRRQCGYLLRPRDDILKVVSMNAHIKPP